MYRKISGQKIKEQRGNRSMLDIVREADNKFTRPALSYWEADKRTPSLELLPYLLKGLGCEFEDITESVDLSYEKN